MTVNLSAFAGAGAQFFDDNGNPLAGGKIYSYQAGSTTPEAVYTTSAGNIAHSNPITLDSTGRVPASGEIWLTSGQSYKFVLNDSANNLIGTYDDIDGVNDVYPINAENVVYDPPFIGGVATDVEAKLSQYPTVDDFSSVADAISAATGGFKILVNDNLTVQIPTDAATLQTAIDALAPNNPQITITLNIESGHLPATGIFVSNGDYSQFRITSSDAEVTLSPLFGISNAPFVRGENAKMPTLACLVDANNRTSLGYAAYYGAVGYVEENCGVKNAYGDGCRAYGGGIVYAFNTIWTGCAQNNTTGSGIISWGGIVFASGSDVSDSMYYGAQAAHGGILVIDNGTANNCFRYNLRATDGGWMSADGVTSNYAGCDPGTNLPYSDPLAAGYGIYAFNGSWIAARDASATNAKYAGVLASNGCTIHARGATLTDCGEYGVYASPCSTVDATTTDVSGAGTAGYYASSGSTIAAGSSTANNCGTGTNDAAAYAENASTIHVENLTATGCSGIAIFSQSGSTINCTGSTITGAGNRAAYASGASRINASDCTGTGATNEGAYAASGSTINIQSSNFQKGGSPSSDDIKVENGSFINAAGATGGVSQTINVLTSEGVIFQ